MVQARADFHFLGRKCNLIEFAESLVEQKEPDQARKKHEWNVARWGEVCRVDHFVRRVGRLHTEANEHERTISAPPGRRCHRHHNKTYCRLPVYTPPPTASHHILAISGHCQC